MYAIRSYYAAGGILSWEKHSELMHWFIAALRGHLAGGAEPSGQKEKILLDLVDTDRLELGGVRNNFV